MKNDTEILIVDTESIDKIIESLEAFKKCNGKQFGSISVYGISKEIERIQVSVDNIIRTIEYHVEDK